MESGVRYQWRLWLPIICLHVHAANLPQPNHPTRPLNGAFFMPKEHHMDKIETVFKKLSAPFEWVVQKARDYPKGFLIVLGVVAVLGFIF